MNRIHFHSADGLLFPAVTEAEMREIDRIAVEEYKLDILQMMENAGRNLALLAMELCENRSKPISILAGPGGNGGGGLCCARHLLNRGYDARICMAKPPGSLKGAAREQMTILQATGAQVTDPSDAEALLVQSEMILDALIGYSLRGTPSGETERLIKMANAVSAPMISLDLPSGMDSTHGTTPGVVAESYCTLTLGLPKTGLQAYTGRILLADIGIPPEIFSQLGIEPPRFPPGEYILPIHPASG